MNLFWKLGEFQDRYLCAHYLGSQSFDWQCHSIHAHAGIASVNRRSPTFTAFPRLRTIYQVSWGDAIRFPGATQLGPSELAV